MFRMAVSIGPGQEGVIEVPGNFDKIILMVVENGMLVLPMLTANTITTSIKTNRQALVITRPFHLAGVICGMLRYAFMLIINYSSCPPGIV